MTYWAQCWQDEFFANLLSFKRGGYYLDIGSGPYNAQSNSYFFDSELGWKGICVEQNSDYVEHYALNRSCVFINDDATAINYEEILDEQEFPRQIDILSVDTDENSARCLAKLPLDKYRFTTCAIENDLYRLGPEIRIQEREIMLSHGYHLLFPIFVPHGCGCGPGLEFEDWWIDPTMFNMEKINKLVTEASKREFYPDYLTDCIKNMDEIFTI